MLLFSQCFEISVVCFIEHTFSPDPSNDQKFAISNTIADDSGKFSFFIFVTLIVILNCVQSSGAIQ